MKYLLAFTLIAPAFASEYWMNEYGNGWGSSEAMACNDAQSQVDQAFTDTCGAYAADAVSYSIDNVTYDRCRCWEEYVNDWRCDMYAGARCEVWE